MVQKKKDDLVGKSKSKRKTPDQVGNIVLGDKKFRFGMPFENHKGEVKYYIWRFKLKIAEVVVKGEEVSLVFFNFKKIGDYKNLILDEDFQKKWAEREKELLESQIKCHLCDKKISKSARPNIYHFNMFKFKSQVLEKSVKVSDDVVSGKLSVSEGWDKFNDILEDGNRYYMSLKETALICPSCAKEKNINY